MFKYMSDIKKKLNFSKVKNLNITYAHYLGTWKYSYAFKKNSKLNLNSYVIK